MSVPQPTTLASTPLMVRVEPGLLSISRRGLPSLSDPNEGPRQEHDAPRYSAVDSEPLDSTLGGFDGTHTVGNCQRTICGISSCNLHQ